MWTTPESLAAALHTQPRVLKLFTRFGNAVPGRVDFPTAGSWPLQAGTVRSEGCGEPEGAPVN
ncbi:hypothetical protein GA0061098_102333 [Bradyrhizobium shewense]|uniref:Uncharacterized protein n=1 Tax=Bradyrhizobium shewense TaxID=1761772 RepID=A0A1C3XP92_9BRAD|nr:hypothetical protein GA0061098_102333 [Bradyrhizobium shewense]